MGGDGRGAKLSERIGPPGLGLHSRSPDPEGTDLLCLAGSGRLSGSGSMSRELRERESNEDV